MSSYDETGYAKDLQKRTLCVVEVASTPTGDNVLGARRNNLPIRLASALSNLQMLFSHRPLHSTATDPFANPALASALSVYSKHYLASQEGIPGEGETIDVILSRLRGEDPHVRRMTVLGLVDEQGKVQGIAFIETYEIDKVLDSGEKLRGLTHLLTYAATELPGNRIANMAFHVGILDVLQEINKSLGQETGDSVLVTEVNSFRDYDGNRTSDKMDDEFEIKTGLPRYCREAYDLGGKPEIITIEGQYNYSSILQINYVPPFLAGEESQQIPDYIRTASQLVPFLINQDVRNGRGEPLYLTAESPDGSKSLTAKQLQLHKAFQEGLVVSVAHDLGIDNRELVLAVRKLETSGFGEMDNGYDKLIECLEVETYKKRNEYSLLTRPKRSVDWTIASYPYTQI